MNLSIENRPKLSWALVYLINLGLGIYLSQAGSTLYPSYFLVLAFSVLGLGLNFLFFSLWKSRSCLLFWIFQIFQGTLGFVVARFVFNLPMFPSLSFSSGALVALLGFLVIEAKFSRNWTNLILAGFYAGGLAVALRLGGVWGGLVWGLALLNGALLGRKLLEAELASIWSQGIMAASLLVIGRAAIQVYLLQSGYVSTGVVITHPYTFMALFAGFLIPLVYQTVQREKALSVYLLLVSLGVLLPLVLGVFFHVRPMAAYLMGLMVAGFAVEMLLGGSHWLKLLVYFNLAAVNFGIPLFKNFANLSRWVRLEVLGGIFLVVIVLYLIFGRRRNDLTV